MKAKTAKTLIVMLAFVAFTLSAEAQNRIENYEEIRKQYEFEAPSKAELQKLVQDFVNYVPEQFFKEFAIEGHRVALLYNSIESKCNGLLYGLLWKTGTRTKRDNIRTWFQFTWQDVITPARTYVSEEKLKVYEFLELSGDREQLWVTPQSDDWGPSDLYLNLCSNSSIYLVPLLVRDYKQKDSDNVIAVKLKSGKVQKLVVNFSKFSKPL